MSFSELNLNSNIFKAITACGYKIPTPIQKRSIPDILNGRDLVASAPTGMGKTAAFVLPALHRISLNDKATKPRVLILTPTRELATQITDAIAKYSKFLPVNIASLVGGMAYKLQLRSLSRRVDIIVATPGRLLDHMENGRVDLSSIEMLILDEADRMLDMGFIDDVNKIAKSTPKERQTLLFSATVDNQLMQLIKNLMNNPIRIDLSNEQRSPLQIMQKLYYADNIQHKNRLLQHYLTNENVFKAIIFSATKVNADDLANQLTKQGFQAATLHGDLKQNVRNKTIERMRRGQIQFLVATDVASRGIDIQDITHVFNYDLPRFSEDYIHRIGRTGRAGKTGTAISFASPQDSLHLQKIERYIGHKLEASVIPGLEPTKRERSAGKPPSRGHGSRGKPSFGDNKYASKKYGSGRPEGERSGGGRSGGRQDGERSHGSRPDGERSFGGRPQGRPTGERSGSGRPAARFSDDRAPSARAAGRSTGERSTGGRSAGRFSDDRAPSTRPAGRSTGERSTGGRSAGRFSDDRAPSARPAGRATGERSTAGRSAGRFSDDRTSSARPAGRSAGSRSTGERATAGRSAGRSSEARGTSAPRSSAGRKPGKRDESNASSKIKPRKKY